MTWTKLDDNFHGHPKIRRAWRDPVAFGLHVMAINYSACYERDGHIEPEFVEDLVPDPAIRSAAIAHLLECNLWQENGRGWTIHDYLEYQPSRAKLQERRDSDSERKRRERGS